MFLFYPQLEHKCSLDSSPDRLSELFGYNSLETVPGRLVKCDVLVFAGSWSFLEKCSETLTLEFVFNSRC